MKALSQPSEVLDQSLDGSSCRYDEGRRSLAGPFRCTRQGDLVMGCWVRLQTAAASVRVRLSWKPDVPGGSPVVRSTHVLDSSCVCPILDRAPGTRRSAPVPVTRECPDWGQLKQSRRHQQHRCVMGQCWGKHAPPQPPPIPPPRATGIVQLSLPSQERLTFEAPPEAKRFAELRRDAEGRLERQSDLDKRRSRGEQVCGPVCVAGSVPRDGQSRW